MVSPLKLNWRSAFNGFSERFNAINGTAYSIIHVVLLRTEGEARGIGDVFAVAQVAVVSLTQCKGAVGIAEHITSWMPYSSYFFPLRRMV